MTPDRWFALFVILPAAIFDYCWYRRAKRERGAQITHDRLPVPDSLAHAD